MPGLVVGFETLRLECEKNGPPLAFRGKTKHQTTILPDAVIRAKTVRVSLVHVNVVYALPRLEVKVLILLLLRPPLLPERKYSGIGICQTEPDGIVDHLTQIVVVAGLVGGQ